MYVCMCVVWWYDGMMVWVVEKGLKG
jgi:hypothetical protein